MQKHCESRTSGRALVVLALFAFTGSLGAKSKCPKSTQLSAKCAPPWGDVAMFVIGSNNIDQAAARMNVEKSSLSWRPAALSGHKRQFLGLSQSRSHGAVATVVPQEGSEVKGMLLYVPRNDRKGDSTLKKMDQNEGVNSGQYIRKTMHVRCYSGSHKLAGIINAEVYLLVGSETTPPTRRAAIVGSRNRRSDLRRKDPKRKGKYITYKAHNNGMVSMDYIKAVRDMLRCSWGRSYSTAKEFPPAAGQSKLVMFDPSKCTYAGFTSRGQKYKSACRGSQMFNPKVPKYSALRYVRDNKKIKAAVPKMPSSRSRLAVLSPLLGVASQGNASSMPFVANATNVTASGLGDPAASEPDGQHAGPGRRLLHVFV